VQFKLQTYKKKWRGVGIHSWQDQEKHRRQKENENSREKTRGKCRHVLVVHFLPQLK